MKSPLRVLILEDSEDAALLLADELERSGRELKYERVCTAPQLSDALCHDSWDIIISDYYMPGFTALDALSLLKASGCDVPVIIVSGRIGEDLAVAAMKAGASDYIMKGSLARLVPAVERELRDANDRKLRKKAEQNLRESEERFRQLAENIDEAIWLTDTKDDQMLYVSPAYEKIWAQPRESLYREPDSWVDAIHPDEREKVLKAYLARQAQGRYDEVYRIVRTDGTIRWIRHRAFPIRGASGATHRSVSSAEDISERRQLEEQLRQSQKLETIGQLAGGVAHDFNNVLTVIQLQTCLLQASAGLTEEALECTKQISSAVEHATTLTRQLLSFSKNQVRQPRNLHLNEVVRNMMKMIRRILGEDITLRIHCSASLPLILADAGMMEQILLNLVVNSRDAMPKGGQLTLTTSVQEIDQAYLLQRPEAHVGQFVRLTVSDTGCGIPKAHLPHIFEPFFTTKEAAKGTGLGLATVHGIVKQHRGWIEVSSEDENGTCFQIFLPSSGEVTPATKAHSNETEVPGGTETILLVEDEKSVRELTRRVLERYGYRVLDAPTAAAALAIWRLQKDQIQLLLTDIVMPDGMGGLELAQRLSREKEGLKVILTSGYSADSASQDFLLNEEMNLLPKPCHPQKLARAIRDCLEGRQIVAP